MQNSEAVQAWIQGKMATFRILVLVSKTEIRSREFSFSSRSLRMKIINLDLVSMPEIGGDFFSVSSRSLRLSVRNSRSRLDVRDWIRETLILVSRMKKWLSLTSASRCSDSLSQEAQGQLKHPHPRYFILTHFKIRNLEASSSVDIVAQPQCDDAEWDEDQWRLPPN